MQDVKGRAKGNGVAGYVWDHGVRTGRILGL